ncbi:MAG: ABC transporter substrate-binding protein [Dehalococcoidia bacterium]|nr:MAG: ABC transporter substrate-binding protein [Dehalococcoidia bacterium]
MTQRLIGAVLILILAACAPATPAPSATGGAAPAPAEQRDEQQILRVGVGQITGNLSPQASASAVEQYWTLYDNVTHFGPNFEVRPSLADRWELREQNRVWRFTLKPTVTWPDGRPVTAHDVAFTFNEMIRANWPVKTYFAFATGATAVDDRTVDIVNSAPDMSVPNAMTRLWVVPKHYYEQVGADGFRQKPMGSGPYEVVEFRDNDSIRFKKRSQPHAFRRPIAEEILFKVVIDNSQKINGLKAGELDLVLQGNYSGAQTEQIRAAGLTILSYPVAPYGIIIPQAAVELHNSPLRDKRVRQAVAYAIDWNAIATKIFNGIAVPASNFSTPGSLYWDPEAKPWPYDPARARQLLAQAGYPNGFRIETGMDTTAAQGIPDTVLAIQGFLRDVGIQVDINPVEFAIIRDKFYGRNGQIWSDIYTLGTADSTGFFSNLRIQWGCGRPIGGAPGSENYCNPEWDRLFDGALSEPDPTRRAEMMRRAAKLMNEDLYVIPGLIQATPHVHTPKVRGFNPDNPTAFNLDSVYKIK